MRGALATLGFYNLYYPPRREEQVDSSYFCEDAARFKSKLHILEQTKEYDAAIQHWRCCAQALNKTLQQNQRIVNESANEQLKELRHAKSDLKRCKEAHYVTSYESQNELARLENELEKAHQRMSDLCERYGEDDTRYSQAASSYYAIKAQYAAKKRSYTGKLERLSARIVHCCEVISKMEGTKKRMLQRQQAVINKAKTAVLDARSRIESLMQKVVGDEVFVPGQILYLLEQDPNVSDATAEKILALTPNYVRTEWHFTTDPGEGTFPLIAACIDDDPRQSMADLIVRVCYSHSCQFTDAMAVLLHLRKTHQLYRVKRYYDGSYEYVPWAPMSRYHADADPIANAVKNESTHDESEQELHVCTRTSCG